MIKGGPIWFRESWTAGPLEIDASLIISHGPDSDPQYVISIPHRNLTRIRVQITRWAGVGSRARNMDKTAIYKQVNLGRGLVESGRLDPTQLRFSGSIRMGSAELLLEKVVVESRGEHDVGGQFLP